MDNKVMKCAIVGCGIISKSYLNGMVHTFSNVEVAAVCDVVDASAKVRSEEYDVPVRSMEQILEDPEIEMVVILTPAPTHYELIKQALLAGKHVFTEKVMTLEVSQAEELLRIADEKGVRLGAAPDTFMGSAVQKAKQVLSEEKIGEVTSFRINFHTDLDTMASKYRILRLPGGGICCDMGVYYLTALVELLGPVAEVAAVVENKKPIRINTDKHSPEFGQLYEYNNEGQVTAILRTASGITGTLCLNGETAGISSDFALIGRSGTLLLANPNRYSDDIFLVTPDAGTVRIENELPPFAGRGLGPSEMADAIHAGRLHRANAQQAYHVLDIIDSLFKSSKQKCFIAVTSRF